MAGKTKYSHLSDFLINSNAGEIRFSFNQIEELLGFRLSPSARTYRSMWSNNPIGPLSKAWLNVGYETHNVDMKNGIVYFRKGCIEKVDSKRIKKAAAKAFSGQNGHVIILNKPFLGGWLDNDEHIGHEIIDFLYTDDDEYYVYNNPWGACPDNIWVEGTTILTRTQKEKYVAKYLLLTSEKRGKAFDILYVIELSEKLHRHHTSKDESSSEYRKNQDEIKKMMRARNIKYNDKYLDEIYGYESLYVTFKGARIYKAQEPIPVNGLEYNFQRNKGYIYDDDFPSDHEKVEQIIIDSIANHKLIELVPRKVNQRTIGQLNATKTFLDLTGLQYNEQVFTNILHSVFEQGDIFKRFCEVHKEDRHFDSSETFIVNRETKVVDGRMDICGESKSQRVIIENKVYSSLNGIKPADSKTQLSTYYIWGSKKPLEPLCFVVAPNFRIGDIKREIEKLDPAMESVYLAKTYGDIANFLEREFNAGNIPQNYTHYSLLPQIIDAFRNLSHSTNEDFYARMFFEATKKLG